MRLGTKTMLLAMLVSALFVGAAASPIGAVSACSKYNFINGHNGSTQVFDFGYAPSHYDTIWFTTYTYADTCTGKDFAWTALQATVPSGAYFAPGSYASLATRLWCNGSYVGQFYSGGFPDWNGSQVTMETPEYSCFSVGADNLNTYAQNVNYWSPTTVSKYENA